jgi:hypothetical protein
MRCPVHFMIEGLPALRLAVEEQELAESLAGPMCVESSEHHLRPTGPSHETIVKILHLVRTRRSYGREHVDFLWKAPLSAATFDRFWTLARVDDYAHVSELVAELHGIDLQEMDVDGDDEAAELAAACLRVSRQVGERRAG